MNFICVKNIFSVDRNTVYSLRCVIIVTGEIGRLAIGTLWQLYVPR